MSEHRVITRESPEWPWRVGALPDAPEQLWVRGDASLLNSRAVAIVGARAATSYGQHIAGELAGKLARAGFTIVSGGAYGIDYAAHRGAMGEPDGKTIIVSAGGIDRPYPAAHRDLFDRADLVVSQYEPNCPPTRSQFLARNGIIAALGEVVVIPEAAYRSGSLNTARHAALLGRPVLAVPGPVTSATSSGTHHLISTGEAVLVTDAGDVLALLNPKED